MSKRHVGVNTASPHTQPADNATEAQVNSPSSPVMRIARPRKPQRSCVHAVVRPIKLAYQLTASVTPLQTYIHLPVDLEQRKHTLCSLQPMQMAMAKRFLRERTRFLDMTEPLESTEVIPSTYCKDNTTVRFFVEPLVARRATMDQVYKIVQEWIADVEKQSAGDPILYHVNETLSETVSQRRLIRTAGDHNKEPLVVESNTVTYLEYDQENEVGLLVSRFVDRDDLRPYRPNERLRRDVTSLMMVSQETPLNTEDPPVIVITGWFSTRQRRGLAAMSRDDDVQLLSNHMNAWCDAKLRYLRDTLRHL